MKKSSSLILTFSIPHLESDKLPGEEGALHRLFVEALESVSFPAGVDKSLIFFDADHERRFLPALEKAVFHLTSSGLMERKEERGIVWFFLVEGAKPRLETIAQEAVRRGRITEADLQASRDLAQTVDDLLPSFMGPASAR